MNTHGEGSATGMAVAHLTDALDALTTLGSTPEAWSLTDLSGDLLAIVTQFTKTTTRTRAKKWQCWWTLRLTCSAFNCVVLISTTKLKFVGSIGAATTLPIQLLRKCPVITELDLRGLQRSPDSLNGCPPTIKVLQCWGTSRDQTNRISRNPFRQLDLSPLVACLQLQELNLGYSRHRVTDISTLANCKLLRKLNICVTEVTNVKQLAACSKLANLNIMRTRIADLSQLAELSALEILNIKDNKRFLKMSISVLSACKMLREISCSGGIAGITETSQIRTRFFDDEEHYEHIYTYTHPDLPGVNFDVEFEDGICYLARVG